MAWKILQMKLLVFICLICIALGGNAQTSSDSSVVMRFRIFYPVNQTDIDEDYMSNATQLHYMQKYLQKSPKIDSITIYSYASPEGPYQLNKRLAAGRGKAMKNYLLKHLPAQSTLSEHHIIIDPTAENWQGLRDLVFYQYLREDKDDVLAILDRTDISDERRKVLLKRLNNGKSWQYIVKELMPHLRYATWILVWQRIGVDRVMEEPVRLAVDLPDLPLPKMEPLGISHPLMEENKKTVLALKTNLLYDALSWVNFSIEFPFTVSGQKLSVLYYHQFPWWKWGENKNEFCMRFLSVGAEGRWWFKQMADDKIDKSFNRDCLNGWFIGAYVESGKWDFQRKRDICYQGEHWSIGLSLGYAMPIGKRLNLELSASVGYASIPRRGYEPSTDYSLLYHLPEKDGVWHYFGPTKAQVSLVLPIMIKNRKGGHL